jgi:hypothetical protein
MNEYGIILEVCEIPVSELKPSEHINNGRAISLANKIEEDGIWRKPLIIEKNTRIVMDGHHRLEVGKILFLEKLPCIILTYDNPHISVTSWDDLTRLIDPKEIINAGETGVLLNYKSTRHVFSIPLPICNTNLNQLKSAYVA